MLKKILTGSDCAGCRFCCSFRRQSLWETPLFSEESKKLLEEKYPEARFKKSGDSSWTVDLIHLYKTDDPEEEAACPFLGSHGCVCTEDEKPFDCSVWPLRVCKNENRIQVMLENVCPVMNSVSMEKILEVVVKDKVGQKMIDYAKKNPDALKPWNPDYTILM